MSFGIGGGPTIGGDQVDFDRHCEEIVAQTTALAGYLPGADLHRAVPTCPGWNASQLMQHVDGGLRWAAEIVGTRATTPPPDVALRDLSGATDLEPATLSASLRQAADLLAGVLTDAGPAATMWCPVDGGGAAFYARRFTHETAIHRADAAIALGVDFVLAPEVAIDGVDEWLELGSLPFHFDVHPWMRELLGKGRTIGLHATDTGTYWLLDLTGDVIKWRRSGEQGAAGLRGPVADLLLTMYRRVPVESGRLEVTGDAALVDFWLERVGFG
jgi:uncharacterized protein (TIGR03083 family)